MGEVIKNICKDCLYWERCMPYRYNNVELSYMEKFSKHPNKDGFLVIYVEECKKYSNRVPFRQKFL